MKPRLPPLTPLGPSGPGSSLVSDAAAAPTPSPLSRAGTVLRGSGWYWSEFPPDQISWFDITYTDTTPVVAGTRIGIIRTSKPPLPMLPAVQRGEVMLLTDWRFLAWRAAAGGGEVPLERNALAGYVSFLLLVGGSPARFQIRGVHDLAATGGYSFLNSRPGPQEQSAGFGVAVPVIEGQTIEAIAVPAVLPANFVIVRLGVQLSGIVTQKALWERVRQGL